MEKLQIAKNAAEAALKDAECQAPAEEVVTYDGFVKFTAHLRELVAKADHQPEIQTAIIKKLVHRIEVTPNGFELEFCVGKNRIKRELEGGKESALSAAEALQTTLEGKGRPSVGSPGFRPPSPPLSKFLKDSGSKRLTQIGGLREQSNWKPSSTKAEEEFPPSPGG